jgi:predicted esterase
MLVYRNYPLQAAAQPQVEQALVMIHGAGRNANDYFASAMSSALTAGKLLSTVVVSPRLSSHDGGCRDTLFENEVNWPCEGWRSGQNALNAPAGQKLFSYDYIDYLLTLFDDKTRFPNLKQIIVAGHSAGGQVVQRYAAGNRMEPKLKTPVRYIVANPSGYVYMNELRLRSGATCSPDGGCTGAFTLYSDGANCTTYNQYKYGLEGLTGYLALSTPDAIRKQYAARKVTYVVGGLDTLQDSDLEKSCPAMAQGFNRYERGVNYWNYMHVQFKAGHRLVVVPRCGHNNACMFASPTGAQAVFEGK